MKAKAIPYAERAHYCQNPVGRQLFQLMQEKQSNLACSADLTHCEDVLALAEKVAPHICVLKTHIDILTDFVPAFTQELALLARKSGFLIFEDRKFADIGNTVKQQYQDGIYHIADWAHLINAHCLPGPGIVEGLAEVGMKKERGLLLLAEMSSSGNLLTPQYAQEALKMAEQFPEFVMGFIAQRRLSHSPQWIYMTPGVQLAEAEDHLGQQYLTPETVLIDHDSDLIIVGRGILKAEDPGSTAATYRQRGWAAYCKKMALSSLRA